MGPLERASLMEYFALISRRLSQLEDALRAKQTDSPRTASWIEFSKIVLGGWPVFGLLLIVMFYGPIRAAINAIPEKVRTAEEIGVLGVSLKNTIRVEAEKLGAIQLSETLPSLSAPAVEFLLRGSRDFNSLTGYTYDEANPQLMTTIWLPSEQTLKTLEELEEKKLITVHLNVGDYNATVADLRRSLQEFKRAHPSRDEDGYPGTGQVWLRLKTPITGRGPDYMWNPTDLGKNAVNIILKAISAELVPRVKTEERKK
jgi:hypothetical protein